MTQTKILSLLFLGLLSISASPIIARSLSSSATIISFWRMFLACGFLWIYSSFFISKNLKLSYDSRFNTFFSGILLGVHFIFFYEAVKITTIANATFLGTLAPFFTLILEFLLLKRSYRKSVYIGLLVAFSGTLLFLIHDFDLSSRYTIGNIYAVLCSISLGISLLIAEKVRKNEGTIEYTRMLYGVAALTIFFIGNFYTESFLVFDLYEILGFIFLALIPTMLGHNIFYYCIKYSSPTIVATVPLGEPIIASVIALFLFLEPISFNTIVGGALCLSGILIILRNKTSYK